jgi:hypothetical protein
LGKAAGYGQARGVAAGRLARPVCPSSRCAAHARSLEMPLRDATGPAKPQGAAAVAAGVWLWRRGAVL